MFPKYCLQASKELVLNQNLQGWGTGNNEPPIRNWEKERKRKCMGGFAGARDRHLGFEKWILCSWNAWVPGISQSFRHQCFLSEVSNVLWFCPTSFALFYSISLKSNANSLKGKKWLVWWPHAWAYVSNPQSYLNGDTNSYYTELPLIFTKMVIQRRPVMVHRAYWELTERELLMLVNL